MEHRPSPEFMARLAATKPEDPFWQGILATIEVLKSDTVDNSSSPGMSADDRAFNDGRQAAFRDLRQQLEDFWVEAQRLEVVPE